MPRNLSEKTPVIVKVQYGGSNIMVKQFYLGKQLKPGCNILMALHYNLFRTAFIFLKALKLDDFLKNIWYKSNLSFAVLILIMYSEHATSLHHQSVIMSCEGHSGLDSNSGWYPDHSGWDCYKGNRFLEIFSDSQCLQPRTPTICLCILACVVFLIMSFC